MAGIAFAGTCLIAWTLIGNGSLAHAADASPSTKTLQPEEEDYSPTPYTAYGEFNEDEDEAEEMRFMQNGKLFGVGFGLGKSGATGERGRLWQGGFPSIHVQTQYWFGFTLALQLELITFKHHFEVSSASGGAHTANMTAFGVNLKYYFDTKNLSAALSFANPNLNVGIGSYTLTTISDLDTANSTEKDNALGINFGLGLEFPIVNKKTYFTFESRLHIATFNDTNRGTFQSAADGEFKTLEGMFYTFHFGLLFVW